MGFLLLMAAGRLRVKRCSKGGRGRERFVYLRGCVLYLSRWL